MIDALLKVADILLGRSDKLREANAERRKRVSLYFENLSRCLTDIATALRNNTEPWQACHEMTEYDNKFNPEEQSGKENLIATVFGEEVANEVKYQLSNLTSVRGNAVATLRQIQSKKRVFSLDRRTAADDELLAESIQKIEQAAGKFKALSVLASTIGP